MLVAVSLFVSALCVVACIRRLKLAIAPTSVDVVVLARTNEGQVATMNKYFADQGGYEWERSLFEALNHGEPMRTAIINEQLQELDWETRRWERVPRVAARVSSALAFLAGSFALRGLLTGDGLDVNGNGVPEGALSLVGDVVSIGLAASVLCAAINAQALLYARRQREAADALVASFVKLLRNGAT